MGLKFAYEDAEGVKIVYAMEKSDLEHVFGSLTDEQYREHVLSRSIPKGVSVKELPNDWVPPPRKFRNIWKLSEVGVEVDETKMPPV